MFRFQIKIIVEKIKLHLMKTIEHTSINVTKRRVIERDREKKRKMIYKYPDIETMRSQHWTHFCLFVIAILCLDIF